MIATDKLMNSKQFVDVLEYLVDREQISAKNLKKTFKLTNTEMYLYLQCLQDYHCLETSADKEKLEFVNQKVVKDLLHQLLDDNPFLGFVELDHALSKDSLDELEALCLTQSQIQDDKSMTYLIDDLPILKYLKMIPTLVPHHYDSQRLFQNPKDVEIQYRVSFKHMPLPKALLPFKNLSLKNVSANDLVEVVKRLNRIMK